MNYPDVYLEKWRVGGDRGKESNVHLSLGK